MKIFFLHHAISFNRCFIKAWTSISTISHWSQLHFNLTIRILKFSKNLCEHFRRKKSTQITLYACWQCKLMLGQLNDDFWPKWVFISNYFTILLLFDSDESSVCPLGTRRSYCRHSLPLSHPHPSFHASIATHSNVSGRYNSIS